MCTYTQIGILHSTFYVKNEHSIIQKMRARAPTYAYTHTHIHRHTHIHIHTQIYIYMYVCVCVCVCACVRMCWARAPIFLMLKCSFSMYHKMYWAKFQFVYSWLMEKHLGFVRLFAISLFTNVKKADVEGLIIYLKMLEKFFVANKLGLNDMDLYQKPSWDPNGKSTRPCVKM